MYAMQETGLTCMLHAGNMVDVYAMWKTGLKCMLCGKQG